MQGDRVLETSLMPKKTRYSSFPQWGFSAYYKHAFVLFPLNQHTYNHVFHSSIRFIQIASISV